MDDFVPYRKVLQNLSVGMMKPQTIMDRCLF